MSKSEIFDKAVEFVLRNEGGYSNDKSDRGGETNWGISKRSYPNLNINALTRQEAIDIYYDDFWEPEYECLDNEGLAIRVFDMSVNSGHERAHLILQKSINACGGNVIEDGVIGSQTISAANKIHAGWLLERFRVERFAFYKALVDAYPENIKFLKGWINRAYL